MEKTHITAPELSQMSDEEFLTHLRKFPYPSQWSDSNANFAADYRLALIQGARYIATGKTSSFKATKLR